MNGAKVAVLEMQEKDKFMWIGGEVGTINSKWNLDHGALEIDRQEFMNEVCRRNMSRGNQVFVKRYVDNSGKLFDWAIEEIDKSWMEENTHVGSCPPDPRMVMDPSGYKFFTGTCIFRAPDAELSNWCWKKVLEHHQQKSIEDGCEWFYSTHADYLEKDESGKVVAVVATDRTDGSHKRYKAKHAVVLSGGDFQGNEDMVRDLNDEYRHLAESFENIDLAQAIPIMLERDGSTIQMAVWAGGHIEVGPRAGMNTSQASPDAPWGPGSPLLNQHGKRYADECAGGTEGAGYMGPRQPKGALVAINDANWEETVYRMPPAHGAIDYRRSIGWPKTVEAMKAVKPGKEPTDVPGYEGVVKVFCANTIEELVEIVGCWDEEEQKAAIESIENYNTYAKNGFDEEFAVDPRIMRVIDTAPFYAAVHDNTMLHPGLCQVAGVDVDSEMRVLDRTKNPIPGLYAVGNNAGNRFIVQYATPISGLSLGYCLVEGMHVGEQIAKSLKA